jgi:hypothetical protein
MPVNASANANTNGRTTRAQARATSQAAAAERKRHAARAAFKFSYKGLTPRQQAITRHNRFLQRVWKVPRNKRMEHTKCVACLGDFVTDREGGYFGIMACDHAIHLDCLTKHADAYLDRLGIPNPNDEDDERTQGMDIDAFMQVCQERFLYRTLGAPCPACRLEFPMRHMQVFDEGRPIHWVPHAAPRV